MCDIPSPPPKRKVAVLGATGTVGQKFVQLLSPHPKFEISALCASGDSTGRPYGDAVRWRLPGETPRGVAGLEVVPPDPDRVDAELIFSALDASVASEVEGRFREAGRTVVSNAKSFRTAPDVPLVVPEVNSDHLALVELQRRRHGGAIVTNPNCSTIGLVLALEPLRRAFGLRRVQVTTMQALSGAGYPGVSSLDALDNVLPHISGEEEKLESEPSKIFGALRNGAVSPTSLPVSAQCNRVGVKDGHLLSISVETESPASPKEAAAVFESFRSPLAGLGLPSAPERPLVLRHEGDRPQPVLDRDACGGMAVPVGRLRACPVLGLRFVALVHNTIRGAAGGTILIAELMAAKGMLG